MFTTRFRIIDSKECETPRDPRTKNTKDESGKVISASLKICKKSYLSNHTSPNICFVDMHSQAIWKTPKKSTREILKFEIC